MLPPKFYMPDWKAPFNINSAVDALLKTKLGAAQRLRGNQP